MEHSIEIPMNSCAFWSGDSPWPFVVVATGTCSSTCFESEVMRGDRRTERGESLCSWELVDIAWHRHRMNVRSNIGTRNASMSSGMRRSSRGRRWTTLEWSFSGVYATALIDRCDTFANRYARGEQYWTWQWSHWAVSDERSYPRYAMAYGRAWDTTTHKSSIHWRRNSHKVEKRRSPHNRSDSRASIRSEANNE